MKLKNNVVILLIILAFWMGGCGRADQPATPTVPPAPTESPSPTEPVVEETAVSPTSTPLPEPVDFLDTPWEDRSIFRSGLIVSEQAVLDELDGASIYHIDIQISDDFLRLDGQEKVHYTNQESEPLEEIIFQLFPNAAGGKLVVTNLIVDGHDVEIVYDFQETALRVSLPTELQPAASTDIQLQFVVDIPQEMGGNYGLFGYFNEVLVLDEFYPVIPVYDDEGWNAQFPPPNGDTSYFDISFYRVRVTAPEDLIIAASGIEVSQENEAGQQITSFAAGPMRDFYLAASSNYILVSETVGETRLNSYALKGFEEGAETALQFAKSAVDSFSDRFGPYPYSEFDVLSTPMQVLGIEYPGIVGITIPAYNPEAEVAGLPFPIMLESVVAHETAHQWFYNIIGNDQIDEPWLDEAHAQYATWLYYVDTYGESNAQGYKSSWDSRWQRVDGAEIPIGLPAYEYTGQEYGAIVYGRGPIFVDELSEEMGAEVFEAFLADYYDVHQWGIATADSYQELAESHCGCDLSSLFERWVYP